MVIAMAVVTHVCEHRANTHTHAYAHTHTHTDVMLTKGADKFKDEILKFREGAYAFALAEPEHLNASAVLPAFARTWFEQKQKHSRTTSNTGTDSQRELARLEGCESECARWNAMQTYLKHTGELHNNVRMTWGKTAVLWLASAGLSAQQCVDSLVHLNDYYALDGFSPPSYAGVLWCCGYGDKPARGGGLSMKSSSRYKMNAAEFRGAQALLLREVPMQKTTLAAAGSFAAGATLKKEVKRMRTVDSYFMASPPKKVMKA